MHSIWTELLWQMKNWITGGPVPLQHLMTPVDCPYPMPVWASKSFSPCQFRFQFHYVWQSLKFQFHVSCANEILSHSDWIYFWLRNVTPIGQQVHDLCGVHNLQIRTRVHVSLWMCEQRDGWNWIPLLSWDREIFSSIWKRRWRRKLPNIRLLVYWLFCVNFILDKVYVLIETVNCSLNWYI